MAPRRRAGRRQRHAEQPRQRGREVERRAERRLGPARGVGEPIWAQRPPDEVAECQLTEELINLAFAGLLTNFPLFSGARFGWAASENAFFFAFVGACAVATQGLLVGRTQRLFGEVRLALGGLALTALCLAIVGGSTSGWVLYPVVGALAVGAGLAVPALLSRRAPAEEQGRLMGGVQAVLSLALISGPLVAGAAFDELGVPAPYFIGAALAALAVPAVALSGRKEPVTLVADPGVAVPGPRGFPTGRESERRPS